MGTANLGVSIFRWRRRRRRRRRRGRGRRGGRRRRSSVRKKPFFANRALPPPFLARSPLTCRLTAISPPWGPA
jgi:hypothetical protein